MATTDGVTQETTVGDLRSSCEAQLGSDSIAPARAETKTEQYLRSDVGNDERNFLMSAHNQNYLLFYTYNDENLKAVPTLTASSTG